ncbi:hypothetical protein OGAPHI_000517 [Ogataea philodendri]|uniref:Uncharacterized protein n=1 Tax=Ogataea philodendri TaxID=1378263 RepID=A0A9P8PHE1_9ASCO|nr:uncharacterized protein OGAPHI_000517 [Ogataea philodendri]KAH3671294.1 hypothetical protein OGAPHI_000517 [Ogataea philodendri]
MDQHQSLNTGVEVGAVCDLEKRIQMGLEHRCWQVGKRKCSVETSQNGSKHLTVALFQGLLLGFVHLDRLSTLLTALEISLTSTILLMLRFLHLRGVSAVSLDQQLLKQFEISVHQLVGKLVFLSGEDGLVQCQRGVVDGMVVVVLSEQNVKDTVNHNLLHCRVFLLQEQNMVRGLGSDLVVLITKLVHTNTQQVGLLFWLGLEQRKHIANHLGTNVHNAVLEKFLQSSNELEVLLFQVVFKVEHDQLFWTGISGQWLFVEIKQLSVGRKNTVHKQIGQCLNTLKSSSTRFLVAHGEHGLQSFVVVQGGFLDQKSERRDLIVQSTASQHLRKESFLRGRFVELLHVRFLLLSK